MTGLGINEAGGRDGGVLVPLTEVATEVHSAALKDGHPGSRNVAFRTAKELAATTAPEVPWIAKPWVACDSITEIVGKVKQAGKSTFIAAMVAAVLEGAEFLDQPTTKSPVIWLTEQSQTSFREVLRRAGLLEREDLIVLPWQEAHGVKWAAVVEAAVCEAKRHGARLLVVDTLGQFAGLRGEGENSAGEALAAIGPLQLATAANLGVIVVRHERKSGGEVGDSGRGSSAFAGAVDIVMALRRPNRTKRQTIRQIDALSRFDETPPGQVIELTDSGYVVLGAQSEVARLEAREAILAAAPTGAAEALGLNRLLEVLSDLSRTVAQSTLTALERAGELKRVGAGKKGDPFRWYRPQGEEGAAGDSFGRTQVPSSGSTNLTTVELAEWDAAAVHDDPFANQDAQL